MANEGGHAVRFPEGTFYDCGDPETLDTLRYAEPEEAIAADFEEEIDEDTMTPAEIAAVIRRRPITVTAYKPIEISDKQIEAWADGLFDKLSEDFSEEHADPDGDAEFPEDAQQIVLEAVRSIIRRARVWSCEPAGKVTLTPDQIEELMRGYCPGWFTGDSDARQGTRADHEESM